MLKNLKAFNLTSHTFIMKVYTFFVSSVLATSLFFSCSSEPKKSEEEKVEKQDSSSKAEVVKTDKSLVGEWVLDKVNNATSTESLNLIFTENGDFSTISSVGSEKGKYSLSEDLKKINFKYEKNDDVWTIVELTDSVLTVSAIGKEKKENLYRFKK